MIITLIIGLVAFYAKPQSQYITGSKPAAPRLSIATNQGRYQSGQAFGMIVDNQGRATLIIGQKVLKFSDYIRPHMSFVKQAELNRPDKTNATSSREYQGPGNSNLSQFATLPSKPGKYLALATKLTEKDITGYGGPGRSIQWLPTFSDGKGDVECVLCWFKANELPKTTPTSGDASFEEIFKDMDWSDRDSIAMLSLALRGDMDLPPTSSDQRRLRQYLLLGTNRVHWLKIFEAKANQSTDDGIKALCILCEKSVGKINGYYESLLPMAKDAVKHESFWLQPELLREGYDSRIGHVDYSDYRFTLPDGGRVWANQMIAYATKMRNPELSHVFLYAASRFHFYVSNRSQAIMLLNIERAAKNPNYFFNFMIYMYSAFPNLNVPGIPSRAKIVGDPPKSYPDPSLTKLFKNPNYRRQCIDAWINALESQP